MLKRAKRYIQLGLFLGFCLVSVACSSHDVSIQPKGEFTVGGGVVQSVGR